MHSVKVTFNADCKDGSAYNHTARSECERDTDELRHRGAGLGRDQGDEAEGEGLVAKQMVLVSATHGGGAQGRKRTSTTPSRSLRAAAIGAVRKN